ncbi:OadG family protein [Oscillibacter valericigenes]|nr:OadG family protein [Oscillibacter valericigenes]
MNEVSNLFVCLMGMGTTFVGLICIIFLTMLMGKIMQKIAKPEPPKAAAAPVPAVPAVPADGLTAEVKIAILAALQQEPGFDLARVSAIDIRKL